MKFDHRHYVPILKGKRAEFPALGALKSKKKLTPLIEAVPSGSAEQVPRGMSGQWPNELPYFIDLLFLDDPDEAPDVDDHPVTLCFAEVVAQGQIAIPVTGLSRSPGYQDAIQKVISEQGNGVALRLVPDDFEDVDELEATLEAFPGFLGVETEQIDLVLDIGSVGDSSAGTVAQIHRANIDLIPTLDDWRTLTVASSAFPLSLAPLVRDQWNTAPRRDWRGWRQLVTGSKPPDRLPSFGDYAIAHPALPPEGRATILAQLRYATPDSWIIWKGRNAITEGYDQFFAICQNLVGRPEYRGANFSWGDAEIAQKAANVGSSGNAETWRRIGTNHHIETVLEQIANLP
jgi:Beta protein